MEQFVKLSLKGSGRRSRSLGVCVGALLLAEGRNDVDEAAVVLDATLGAARLLLLLLLFVHFGCLSSYFTSAGQRPVDFTSQESGGQLDGAVLGDAAVQQRGIVLQRSSGQQKNLLLHRETLQSLNMSLEVTDGLESRHIECVKSLSAQEQLHDEIG